MIGDSKKITENCEIRSYNEYKIGEFNILLFRKGKNR